MNKEEAGQAQWQKSVLPVVATLKDAALSLTESCLGICLIIDDEEKLVGTLTDGDIRRGDRKSVV